jgi:tellurium resistance protein TerD
MAISLKKGENTSLSDAAPGMTKMAVGLGWNARTTSGETFDLDASAFMLNEGDKVSSDAHFIFYNQNTSPEGSVKYLGDNRTGDGEGDDETIVIQLDRVPTNILKIAVCVTIHSAVERRQNFGQVAGAFIRCIDASNNNEIARFDLSEDFSVETSVVFGTIYRHAQTWKFRAVGQGYSGGLDELCRVYGVQL